MLYAHLSGLLLTVTYIIIPNIISMEIYASIDMSNCIFNYPDIKNLMENMWKT